MKESQKGCDLVPLPVRKWLYERGYGVQENPADLGVGEVETFDEVPLKPIKQSERQVVDTSFIKEIHGDNTPLGLEQLLALRDSKNQDYLNGNVELQRDSHTVKAVEIIRKKDFDSLHTKTGHIDFEDYLASKYAVINTVLAEYGLTAEVSRVIVIEDDVDIEAAGFPTSWHGGWTADGFLDSNGAHGVWFVPDDNGEFDPTRDGRWDADLMASMDDIHEWFHYVAHIPHTYESDAQLQNAAHPALAGIPAAWHQYYDRYRWREDFMNGGDAQDLSDPLDEIIRRRMEEGWLHDDARCINETGGYPYEIPPEVILNFGKEWAGASVAIYRIESSDGTYFDTSKVLEEKPFATGTTATEKQGDLEVGDVEFGDLYIEEQLLYESVDGKQQILDAKNTLMLVVVEKEGEKGWMYLSWGDLFLAGDVDRERLNIKLATEESPDPEDFDFSVVYGHVPEEFTLYMPLVIVNG